MELRAACCKTLSPETRDAAWKRYEIKRTFESVCGPRVKYDLNELEPQMAAEVAELRRITDGTIPWSVEGPRKYATGALPAPPLPYNENPLRGPGVTIPVRRGPPALPPG